METTGENSGTLCHKRHVGEEDKREREREMGEDQRKVLPGVCVCVCAPPRLSWAFMLPGSSLSEGIDPTQQAWYPNLYNQTGTKPTN